MSQRKLIFQYGEDHLTAGKALSIARGQLKGELSNQIREKLKSNRQVVDHFSKGKKAVYGINTGFGPLCSTRISSEDTVLLQYNILKSHAVGVGAPVSTLISKLMLILKMHALSLAHSGISIAVLERIQWHIDNDIIPIVPSQGSVGASGDLAPLAHLFLPLIGEGAVVYRGKAITASELFQLENLSSVELLPKEGLALINGTQFIAAHAVVIIEKLHNCLSQSDLIAALMVEGLLGSSNPFHPELHELRPYPANQHVSGRIFKLLNNSEIVASHEDCERVQDPYSLRCVPQVHGASRTSWLHLKELTEIELNSVTDNPVIIDSSTIISGGNFHGQPLALALDYAAVAGSEIGNISDRRIYLSLMGVAQGVPKLLMENTGTNSAFMMLQYTSAALASENKSLCFPASADSIPTSLGQEDHVSMGSISGRKTLKILDNLEYILAIEMICAAQSFDFHHPLKSSTILNGVHSLIRTKIAHADADRVFKEDIEQAVQLVRNKTLLKIADQYKHQIETGFEDIFENF